MISCEAAGRAAHFDGTLLDEAVDALEAKDAEIDRLRKALEPFQFIGSQWGSGVSCMHLPIDPQWIQSVREALAAHVGEEK